MLKKFFVVVNSAIFNKLSITQKTVVLTMRPKVFYNFNEVEEDIRKNAPLVVYKYRSWDDNFHKDLLINRASWFSHPFDLNDSLDVRPETIFDESEIHDRRYFQKMLREADTQFPELSKFYRLLEAIEHWNKIKANPQIVTKNMLEWYLERSNFNRIGVFSTCGSGINERMWDEYGNQSKGYSIGFHTVEICRHIDSAYGIVKYTDSPYLHSFLKGDGTDYDERHDTDPFYTKKTKWAHENEFRFITVGIGQGVQQLQHLPVSCVAEIILGYDISSDDEKRIMQIVSDNYPESLPVFKINKDSSGQLIKIRIK